MNTSFTLQNLFGLSLFYFQTKMVVGGYALQVFFLGAITDIRVNIPAITFVLPDTTRNRRTLLSANKIETITVFNSHFRDALQTYLT